MPSGAAFRTLNSRALFGDADVGNLEGWGPITSQPGCLALTCASRSRKELATEVVEQKGQEKVTSSHGSAPICALP